MTETSVSGGWGGMEREEAICKSILFILSPSTESANGGVNKVRTDKKLPTKGPALFELDLMHCC